MQPGCPDAGVVSADPDKVRTGFGSVQKTMGLADLKVELDMCNVMEIFFL